MSVIFIGSSVGNIPRVGGKTTDGLVHRAAHVVEYAVLGVLTLRAISQGKKVTRRDLIILLIIVAVYGASDEFHQRFTPGRSSEGITVVFDVAGGMIGAWVWWMRTTRLMKRRATTSRTAAEQSSKAINTS